MILAVDQYYFFGVYSKSKKINFLRKYTQNFLGMLDDTMKSIGLKLLVLFYVNVNEFLYH